MPRGLPLAYIKKWGISKLAWQKFREGALTKGVPTRTVAIKRRLKGEKKPMTKKGKGKYTKRKGRRRGGTRWGIKGLIIATGVVTGVKYLLRRFLPIVPTRYEDSIGLVGAGAIGSVAKLGTKNYLKAGLVLGGSTLITDLLVGGGQGALAQVGKYDA